MTAAASLKKRSFKAGAWLGATHVVGQVVRLASNLILARLLVPEAFGLMALISSMMMALNLVSDIGTGPVIVQSQRGGDRDFLNTAWTLQVIRGVVLWGCGLLLALFFYTGGTRGWFAAGTAFSDPRLPLMIAVATFGLVINGLSSIKLRLAERNLDLRMSSIADLIGGFATAGAMVVGAWLTGSVWALVFGTMFGTAVRSLLSHTMLTGPSAAILLERDALRELLGKGKWLLVSTLLSFGATNLDRILLGGLTDATALGLYSIAAALSALGSSIPSMLLMKVAYPAISEVVRERPQALLSTYRRLQWMTDLCLGLMAGAIYMASDAIVDLLYDDRYLQAGPILAALGIGLMGPRLFVVDLVYTAKARNALVAALLVPRVIVLAVGLPVGYTLYGFDGAIVAIVASQFAHWPTALWYRAKEGLGGLRSDMVLPVALAAGLAIGWLVDAVLVKLMA